MLSRLRWRSSGVHPMLALPPADHAVAGSRRPVVLFVEPDVLLRQSVAHDLREAGLDIVEVADGAECLEVLQSNAHVDLMCTEMQGLGEFDGESLALKARTMRPELRIVVASTESPKWPFRQTIDGFIGKPYDNVRVSQRINALLTEAEEES
jgi:CheY-like chemotaxis protein